MYTLELDSILNQRKLFNPPGLPPRINFSELPRPPQDWVIELESLCKRYNSSLARSYFDQHITYAYQQYIPNLELIYHRLKGNLNHNISLGPLSEAERCSIITKLTEEINTTCSAGFYERVNAIIIFWVKPRTLPELLCTVSQDVVSNLATQEVNASANTSMHIHTWSNIMKVAARHDLIVTNFEKSPSPYATDLEEKDILHKLKEEFKKKYTPFNLIFLLIQQLHGVLVNADYKGFQENGYAVGPGERIADIIKCYLSKEIAQKIVSWPEIFIHNDDQDEDGNYTTYIDLNWPLIRKYFLSTLIQEKYFLEEPSEKNVYNLLDCAYFSELCLENSPLSGYEGRYITNQPFNKEIYLQLESIKTSFPDYWKKLRINHHQDLIRLFLHELGKTSFYSYDSAKKTALVFALDLSNIHEDLNSIKESSLLPNVLTHLLMFAARHQPERLEDPLLHVVEQHSTSFNGNIIQQLFLKKDHKGQNLLTLVAQAQSETAKKALQAILAQHFNFIEQKSVLSQLFLKNDSSGWNFSLAAVLLEKYLNYLLTRETQAITHTTTFFGFKLGYSTKQKKEIALKLKATLQDATCSIDNLSKLEKEYPALRNGTLSLLFNHLKTGYIETLFLSMHRSRA